jgi:DnaB-like helicase N terminal domain
MQPLDPPSDYEIEQQLLGTILIDNRAYLAVCEFLWPKHLGNAAHRLIFYAIRKLLGCGQVANPLTVKTCCEQLGILSEIGGISYLARLAACGKEFDGAEGLGRELHYRYLRREDEETLPGNQIIADHLVEFYDLVPFILMDGHLGIHFNKISYSTEGKTLIEIVREEIASMHEIPGQALDEHDRADLEKWHATLAEALAAIDAAIGELNAD